MQFMQTQTLRLYLLATATFSYATAAVAGDCKQGFVPRAATPGDKVCVTPASRARVAAENARAPLLWTPGSFGPKTCAQGYVWRLTAPTDLICVRLNIRSDVAQENSLAAQNRQP